MGVSPPDWSNGLRSPLGKKKNWSLLDSAALLRTASALLVRRDGRAGRRVVCSSHAHATGTYRMARHIDCAARMGACSVSTESGRRAGAAASVGGGGVSGGR